MLGGGGQHWDTSGLWEGRCVATTKVVYDTIVATRRFTPGFY